MVLWLALFVLVIAISFVLALQSMRDYQDSPKYSKVEYGLFLIRNSVGLTVYNLDLIHELTFKKGFLFSLERLFKGNKSALVIYAPKNVLAGLSEKLSLLELEDYTQVDSSNIAAWEVGIRKPVLAQEEISGIDNFFKNLPHLNETEQFFWQLILQANPKKGKNLFTGQIRAVLCCADEARRKKLVEDLHNLPPKHLAKVPKPFTSEQILEFYKMRALSKSETNPTLTSEEVLKLSLL